MMDWMGDHGPALKLGMFVVWVVYMQLFLMPYPRLSDHTLLGAFNPNADRKQASPPFEMFSFKVGFG